MLLLCQLWRFSRGTCTRFEISPIPDSQWWAGSFFGVGVDLKPLSIFLGGGGEGEVGTVGIGFENILKHFGRCQLFFLGGGAKVFEKTLYPLYRRSKKKTTPLSLFCLFSHLYLYDCRLYSFCFIKKTFYKDPQRHSKRSKS